VCHKVFFSSLRSKRKEDGPADSVPVVKKMPTETFNTRSNTMPSVNPNDATDAFEWYRRNLHHFYPDPEVSVDEDAPIVLTAVIARCGHNRCFQYFLVKRCPSYLWAHVFDRSSRQEREVVVTLSESGHQFSVEVEYQDVGIMEFADLQGDREW
jgi:hypothetical protein